MFDTCSYCKCLYFTWVPVELMFLQFEAEKLSSVAFPWVVCKHVSVHVTRNNVVLRSLFIGEASTVRSNWSDFWGIVSVWGFLRAAWAKLKLQNKALSQVILSEPSRPMMASSRFGNKDACCGMNLETALNEPMYDRISEQVLDGWTVARGDSLCLLGDRVPEDQCRRKILAVRGQITIFFADKDSCSQRCVATHVRSSLKFLLQNSHQQKDHLHLLLESPQC